ncbi:hypothetical protein B0T17DRAFT_591519 [Bombardia bombarda]|uniref:Uncharacterized protein n=1 Tax=Bombardia bombarda TaxID=252184 RepID=A0AA39WU66_9PEZI|nr:hypothetical protein B0T17DRAFT_591519 [Bombardia bombarda]
MSQSNNDQSQQVQKQQQQQPGLVSSHVEYLKGAAESAIGNVMGLHAWTTTGEQDKAHAQSIMKAATENRDPSTAGYGKVEEVAGKLTGCEGMRKEGAASSSKPRSE